MSNLKQLNACCFSGIDQKGINELNLIELNASGNPKITDFVL